MTCTDDWKVGMIGSAFMLGWAATLLWLPAFADRGGRKKYLLAALIGIFCIQCFMFVTHSLAVMITLYFLIGCLNSWKTQVGYTYMLELYSKKHHSIVSSWWCIEDVLVYVMAVIYFWKISVHWIWYALFGQVCTIASILILVLVIPESPRFLASQGRY